MYRIKFHALIVAFVLSLPSVLDASEDSNGPNGINSIGLQDAMGNPLTGLGVELGQVERLRPGKPVFDTDAMCCNADVDPTGVFVMEMNATSNQEYGEHALWVAGVMISKDTDAPMDHSPPTGVSPDASLYSSAHTNMGVVRWNAALASQHVATVADVRAINLSFGLPLESGMVLDGFSHLTQFLDWSASAFQHDVLYVVAGNELSAPGSGPVPTDNYNGMTVAASGKIDDVGKFRRVASFNVFTMDAVGTRTSTDILAPGLVLDLTGVNGTFPEPPLNSGTSFAAPHVTGTVALLQQYANERIMNAGAPHWKPDPSPDRNAPARRHEVMKAVLMNSADKIEGILGMERTVLMQGSITMNWFDSPAHDNPAIPLDLQMGAGHLNAKRAVEQFAPGEIDVMDVGNVPLVGWDFGKVELDHPVHKYVFDQPLQENDYVSITLAWDRNIQLEFDNGPTLGAYDAGETFFDQGIVNVDLYLLPAGATDTSNPIPGFDKFRQQFRTHIR